MEPDFNSSAEDLIRFTSKPIQLQDYLVAEDDYGGYADVCYDIREIIRDEDLSRLLIEFLEQYPTWTQREVHFSTHRKNIPLVEEATILVHLPDYKTAEIVLPLYQYQVKGNSEDVWRIFKAVMKGENTPVSWRRHLEDFEELHPTNTYHVRRLESAEIKRQVILDFVDRYQASGIKQVPIKLERNLYPWFILTSKREGKSIRLCVVVDKETVEQNHMQFFDLARVVKERQAALSATNSPAN